MPLLEDVKDFRLGSVPATAAYVGSEKVWPIPSFSPADIPGLALWLDASQLPQGGDVLPDQRMLADTAPNTTGTGYYTVGARFMVNSAGQISHIRYWHSAACLLATHALGIWTEDGVKRASAVDSSSAGVGGWREVALPSPLPVLAGTSYTASVTVDGSFQYTPAGMTSLSPALGALTAYYGNGTEVYPSTSASGYNYHVDVVFQGVTPPPAMTSWDDLSGGGNHGAIVGSPPPMLIPHTLNDLPVVRFKSSEGRIRGNVPVLMELTFFYVVRRWGPTPGRAFTATYPGTAAFNYLVGFHTSSADWFYDNGAPYAAQGWVGPMATPPTPWKLYGSDGKSTGGYQSRFFINGVQHGVDWPNGQGIGGKWNLSGYSISGVEETMDCEVAELVMYDRKLPDLERQQIEAYLREKWGLT